MMKKTLLIIAVVFVVVHAHAVPPGSPGNGGNRSFESITIGSTGEHSTNVIFGDFYSPHRKPANQTLIGGFEAVDEWTKDSGSGTLSLDTTNELQGDGCLDVASAGKSTTLILSKTGSWDFSRHSFFLNFRIDLNMNRANWDALQIYMIDGDGVTKSSDKAMYQAPLGPVGQYFTSEWFGITLGRAAFVNGTGTINWSNIVEVQIQFDAQPGWDVDILLDNFYAFESSPIPIAIIRFDDSNETDYTLARPVLDTYGYRGVSAAIADTVGSANKLTAAQLQALDKSGWDISIHGNSDWATLTVPELRAHFIKSVRTFNSLGIYRGPRFAAYPSGSRDNVTPDVKALVNRFFCAGFAYGSQQYASAWKEFDPWWQTQIVFYSSSNTADIKTYIDDLVSYGGIMQIGFHAIHADTPSGLVASVAELQEIVDYLNASGVFVLTYSDLYDNIVQAAHPPVNPFEMNYSYTVTDDTTLTNVDHDATILIDASDCSDNDCEITLPDSADNHGMPLTFKVVDATDSISIVGAGTDTIENAAVSTDYEDLDAADEVLKIVNDGENTVWRVIYEQAP